VDVFAPARAISNTPTRSAQEHAGAPSRALRTLASRSLVLFTGPSSRGGGAAMLDPAATNRSQREGHQRALEAAAAGTRKGVCLRQGIHGGVCAWAWAEPFMCLV